MPKKIVTPTEFTRLRKLSGLTMREIVEATGFTASKLFAFEAGDEHVMSLARVSAAVRVMKRAMRSRQREIVAIFAPREGPVREVNAA